MVRIIGINGSMRNGSTTLKTLRIALEGAAAAGAKTELIDLREWILPMFEKRDPQPDIVNKFKEKVMRADGVILASPEYHGTLSGVMKNALDYLTREEIQDKAIAAVATAGSDFGAQRTLMALQQIGQMLRGWPVRTTASVPASYNAFDGERLKDSALAERLKKVGSETVLLAEAVSRQASTV